MKTNTHTNSGEYRTSWTHAMELLESLFEEGRRVKGQIIETLTLFQTKYKRVFIQNFIPGPKIH
jgi:hypothetical protein